MNEVKDTNQRVDSVRSEISSQPEVDEMNEVKGANIVASKNQEKSEERRIA